MPENKGLYDVYSYGDRVTPGDKINLEHSIRVRTENTDMSQLTALPLEELQAMREESAAAEKAVFESLKGSVIAWEEQATATQLIDKAVEYIKTPAVKHTSNEWQKSENDFHELSNMVYKMTYHLREDTRRDPKTDQYVPVAWDLRWSVYTNPPENRRYGSKDRIAGQDKRFADKAEMEKYLAGRIKAHAHLFTEISPPIPEQYAKNFHVNDQLLPGYTIEGQKKQLVRAAEVIIGGDSVIGQKLRELRKEPISMNEPLNMKLSNREQLESGSGEGVWLKLPATAEQLNAALARIGVEGGEQGKDYIITGLETPIPAIERIPLENARKAGIDELNFLAARLEMFGKEHVDKLNAASQIMADSGDIHHLIEYTFCPQFYELYPDITTHAQLGEFVFNKSGLIQIPDEWAAAIDREKLGQLAAAHEKGLFTEQGYIVESGTEGSEWQTITDIPQDYRIAPKTDRPDIDRHAPATNITVNTEPKPPSMTQAAPAPVIPINLTAENPRERMKEITAKLEAGIKGIFDSEKYKTYLQTLSKFHNYSFNNCILIAMQKPDATRVAGFNDWRDNFKRQVKKGEKGIKILAPAPFKTTKSVDAVDVNGKPLYDNQGKRVKAEQEITVPAFKVTTVFDVSQTEGEPLPQIGVDDLTGSVDRYKDFFAALEKTSRVPIAFEAITDGAKGFYHQVDKRIAINEGMSELDTLRVAVHEIVHSRLHDRDLNAPKDAPRPDQHTREVEAESIAYTVCARYGLDTSDSSFGYVAEWSGNKQMDVLKASLDTIRKEADAIITEIDKHFGDLSQNREQTVQPGFENWSEPATPDNAPDNPGAPSDNAAVYFPQQGGMFSVYQLKDNDDTRDIRFEPFDSLKQPPDAANYENVYTAPLRNGDTLDSIYTALNMDKPEDFKGHSLSVSDVVVFNRDGKETAFYVDTMGFKDLPDFLTPKEQARETPAPAVNLAAVADYMQKLNDGLQAVKPDSSMSIGAFNATVKRLEAANERIPDNQPQLKALIVSAAQSPDFNTLKERMNTLHTEFTQHYSTAVQMTIDTSAKAEPTLPKETLSDHIADVTVSRPPAPKAPAHGENVAAIEAQVKAGEVINLSDLSAAMKKDQQAAQTGQPGRTATGKAAPQTGQTRTYGKGTPAAPEKPSIRDKIAEGRKEIAAQKPAPSRVQNKTASVEV